MVASVMSSMILGVGLESLAAVFFLEPESGVGFRGYTTRGEQLTAFGELYGLESHPPGTMAETMCRLLSL